MIPVCCQDHSKETRWFVAEVDLQRFLQKVQQLNALVASLEQDPARRAAFAACSDHNQVVQLARVWGYEIGRRWGEQPAWVPPLERQPEGRHFPQGQRWLIRCCAAASLHRARNTSAFFMPGSLGVWS